MLRCLLFYVKQFSPSLLCHHTCMTLVSLLFSVYIPATKCYEGKLGDCKAFLFQCSLVFELQPLTYINDWAKIAHVLGSSTGRTRSWGSAFWHSSQNANPTFAEFSVEMSSIFDHPVASSDASNCLLSLRQGSLSAANYSVEFRTLATELGWGEKALQSIFLKGLNEAVKDSLVGRAETADLQGLIALAIKVDNRLRERRRERLSGPRAGFGEAITSRLSSRPPEEISNDTKNAFSSSRPEEPMQLGQIRLTPTERDQRIRGGLCLYCEESGHQLATCPQRLNLRAHQSQTGFWWVAHFPLLTPKTPQHWGQYFLQWRDS